MPFRGSPVRSSSAWARTVRPIPTLSNGLFFSCACFVSGAAAKLPAMHVMYPTVHHLALRRVRWLVTFLVQGGNSQEPIPTEVFKSDRPTIHCLPRLSTREWIDQTVNALAANGHGDSACALSSLGADH